MTDRPILFSAAMVRALIDGRKTQTRRLAWRQEFTDEGGHGKLAVASLWQRVAPGDRLWVRENFVKTPAGIAYVADGSDHFGAGGRLKMTPCIHMPRWASRLTLTVTAKRSERLQQITEEDARAEGCPVTWDGKPYDPPPPEVDSWQGYGRASFFLLWCKLHGSESWKANPELVVISFAAEQSNIDALGMTRIGADDQRSVP